MAASAASISTTNTVMLDGDPLDVAVAKLIEKKPHWQAQPDDTAAALAAASQTQERTALEEQAKTGNATAQGKLFKLIGEAEYGKFAAQHGIAPGKAATVKADGGDNANETVASRNRALQIHGAAPDGLCGNKEN